MPSSSSSTISTARARSEVPLPAKLSAAQSELQACEAHLASKERELAAMRTAAVRRGLSVRCTALAECGQAWTAMGTEALRSLGTLEADAPVMNGFGNGDGTCSMTLLCARFHSYNIHVQQMRSPRNINTEDQSLRTVTDLRQICPRL